MPGRAPAKPRRGSGAAPSGKSSARKQATTTAKGRWAEDLALAHLRRRGLRLIARNYRCRAGEADLILDQAGVVVVVEVRYRASSTFGGPKETVNWRKQQRLARVAGCFLRAHPDLAARRIRFDVVAVTRPNYRARLEWIQNAFEVDDSF